MRGGNCFYTITKHDFLEEMTTQYIWCCYHRLIIGYSSFGKKWTRPSALHAFRRSNIYSSRHVQLLRRLYKGLRPLSQHRSLLQSSHVAVGIYGALPGRHDTEVEVMAAILS